MAGLFFDPSLGMRLRSASMFHKIPVFPFEITSDERFFPSPYEHMIPAASVIRTEFGFIPDTIYTLNIRTEVCRT